MNIQPVPVTYLRTPTGRVVLPRDVYLSASMSRASEMLQRARTLQRFGLRSVASWVRSAGDETTAETSRAAALQDLRDLDAAGLVLAFSEFPGSWTGGRHVELGYALAQAKRVVVIGPLENVFHHHPLVLARFDRWQQFCDALEAPRDR